MLSLIFMYISCWLVVVCHGTDCAAALIYDDDSAELLYRMRLSFEIIISADAVAKS
jgi:hypothetical protein